MALHVGGPLNIDAAIEKHHENDLPPKLYAEAVINKLSNDSIDSLDSIESGDYTGSGEALPTSPKKGHRKRPSSRDLKNKADQQKVEQQKYQNGEKLASTAPDADYEESLKLDEMERKPRKKETQSELVSGRKAGSGWERSG
jgi:hypothetical protein